MTSSELTMQTKNIMFEQGDVIRTDHADEKSTFEHNDVIGTNHADEDGVIEQRDEVTGVFVCHYFCALHAADEVKQ